MSLTFLAGVPGHSHGDVAPKGPWAEQDGIQVCMSFALELVRATGESSPSVMGQRPYSLYGL